MRLQWDDLIEEKAKLFALDPFLVKAIIYVESAGDKYAARFEPKWTYFYRVEEFADDNNITAATERVFQATSLGLMQIMGSVVRELGWGASLVEVFNPEVNITYGCKKLNQFSQRYTDRRDIIASYNAGSPRRNKVDGKYVNQKYVDKVLYHIRQLEKKAF